MKSSTFSRSAQRNLESQPVNATFKASSQLHGALMKEYKRPENSSMVKVNLVSTGKESVRLARQEKEMRVQEQTIQSEVASLPKFVIPVYREQTHVLVETQKASRRERHLKLQDEFDRWVSRLQKNIQEAYKDIKRDIREFFQDSDKQITSYYDSLTDENLLEREIEFVSSIRKTVEEHELKRNDKVSNLDQRLEGLEKERQRSLENFCKLLEDGLIDVAFQLEPEIKETVLKFRVEFEQLVKEKREQNRVYLQEVNTQQQETFKMYKETQMQKEQRWRDLKHNHYIKEFNTDIQKLEYVYPDLRKSYYKQFKQTQVDIFKERKQYLERLNNFEIGSLTKSLVEKWLDEVKQYNDLASRAIDVCCDNLLKETQETHAHGLNRYEELKKQLHYAAAKSQEELDHLLEEQFLTQVTFLNTESRDLMKKAIDYFESIDQQQTNIMQNYGQFYVRIAQKNDEYKTEIQLLSHNYEIMKAQTADKNDDHLDELKKQLDKETQDLIEALHHPKLEECANLCQATLDKFIQEYERFHHDNQELAAKHPDMIFKQHQTLEKNLLTVFDLVDPSKEELLKEKFRRAAETKIKYAIAKEEYLKKIEEEKAIEDAKNKKGGKPPASKPKDPKKFQQELEERMKQLAKEFPTEEVEKYSSELSQSYVAMKHTMEIVERMYSPPDEQENLLNKEKQELSELEQQVALLNAPKDPKAKPAAPPPIELPAYVPEADVPPKGVDFEEEAPKNVLNEFVLEKQTVIKVEYLSTLINNTKQKVIEYIHTCLKHQQDLGKESDEKFIKDSQTNLEQRQQLIEPQRENVRQKAGVRSQQIKIHKKRYERYARQLVDKIDAQTEQVNFFLEGGLLDMKDYIKDQQQLKNSLSSATTLAKLQGIQNAVKENYFKFGEKISDLEAKLSVLANQELDLLIQRNREFMRDCKHQRDGGEYSTSEIEWYQGMLDEHNNTINKNKEQRNQRLEEIKKVLNMKRQEQLDKFEQEYAIAVEDLAAKDGTGKKYGRPKRIAQEKLRTEMTKCEKAQEAINLKFEQIKKFYEEYSQTQDGLPYSHMDPSFSVKVRKVLMGLLLCIRRYAGHIEALKPDHKAQDMPRITSKETKFDTVLEPDEVNEDKKLMELELESMGPLYYNGEKKFVESINEIEKIIKDEATKIYADKPKFLTGTDKLPDYLRAYIENMQRNMVEFRISSVRELRNTCEELSEWCPKISEMVILSNKLKFVFLLKASNQSIWDQFKLEQTKQNSIKALHQKQLRPNLGNPQCKDELDDLKKRESQRLGDFMGKISQFLSSLLDSNFQQGDQFLRVACQNFEFLVTYFDSLLLFEDFIKLPGDEQIQKKHQNIKVSLRQRQSGQIIDTNSERSLSKAWDGILLESFTVGEKKVEYTWQANIVQKVDPKDPKQAKKEEPKKAAPGGKQAQEAPQVVTHTTSIKSFKTFRQKSAKHFFVSSVQDYLKEFKKAVDFARAEMTALNERELKFEFKWEQSIASL